MAKAKNKTPVKKATIKPGQEPQIETVATNKPVTFESPAKQFICYVGGYPYKFVDHRLYIPVCSDKLKEALLTAGCKEV